MMIANATPRHSALPRPADPRIVILSLSAVIAAALFAVGATRAIALLCAYVVVITLVFAGGPGALRTHVRRLWPFFVIIVILNGLAVPGRPALTLFGWRVLSIEGLLAGVFFSVRLAVMYLALSAILSLLSPEALARGTAAIVRPLSSRLAAAVSFHAFLAMSFVPLFGDEFRRIRQAQSFRGGTLAGGFRDRVAAVRLIVVPLLLSAIRRSEQLAMIVELRGIRETLAGRQALDRPAVGDWAFVAVTAIVIGAAVFGMGGG